MKTSTILKVTITSLLMVTVGWTSGLPGAVAADEEASSGGTINGRVIYRTGEEKPLTEEKVVLHIFDESSLVDRMETNTDEEGSYRFENIPLEENYSYMVAIFYKGVLYLSDQVPLNRKQVDATADISVYDVTTDDSALAIQLEQMVVYMEENALRVHEILIISNKGDRSVVARTEDGLQKTLSFSLPPGFFAVEKPSGPIGGTFSETEDGLVTNIPLTPGQSQIAFSYKLRTNDKRYTLRKRLDYPMKELYLFISDVGIKAESGDLVNQGTANMGNERFIKLVGSNLERGQMVSVVLENLNPPGTMALTRWLALVFAVALVAISYLYPFRRGNDDPPDPTRKESDPQAPKWLANYSAGGKGKELVREIAALDDEFKKGTLDAAQYKRERGEKKRKLISLLNGRKDSTP